MAPNVELGEFLRSRRARVRPDDLGLPDYGSRRRVPGLRRQEAAQLAGVSVEYYVRLEQGRAAHPSEQVLDAIATALRLDAAERAHLFSLAKQAPPRRRQVVREKVRPNIQLLLDSMPNVPAFVLGRRMDVLAWNQLAAALIVDFGALPPEERNMARLAFLDPSARDYYPEWAKVGKETAAYLRLVAGRFPDDQGLISLVGELSLRSPEFRRWWADHDVRDKANGVKRLNHPMVGEVVVAYESLALAEPGQTLVTYTVEPGTPSAAALALLSTLTSDTASNKIVV
ncbi:helix-turn-helix domain-containing protein [Solihabitans fulvus]|uniref:Helix-turn-helix domain-containing protein n=1 Tax=Solihabitans fulvus TaxID=1892852 RepID=A0A5B2X6K7_9PSEU|nr:helix-turn-helix transcriptional regulator [Solihabitans fulvus]KAA2258846.1 helix-turn-helix domain-containing protein [Solihabitans fulvus]